MKTNRPMLDINSDSYRMVLEYLSRLEDPKFKASVHIPRDKAIIELSRLNLKFIIDLHYFNGDGTYEMDSNEFS